MASLLNMRRQDPGVCDADVRTAGKSAHLGVASAQLRLGLICGHLLVPSDARPPSASPVAFLALNETQAKPSFGEAAAFVSECQRRDGKQLFSRQELPALTSAVCLDETSSSRRPVASCMTGTASKKEADVVQAEAGSSPGLRRFCFQGHDGHAASACSQGHYGHAASAQGCYNLRAHAFSMECGTIAAHSHSCTALAHVCPHAHAHAQAHAHAHAHGHAHAHAHAHAQAHGHSRAQVHGVSVVEPSPGVKAASASCCNAQQAVTTARVHACQPQAQHESVFEAPEKQAQHGSPQHESAKAAAAGVASASATSRRDCRTLFSRQTAVSDVWGPSNDAPPSAWAYMTLPKPEPEKAQACVAVDAARGKEQQQLQVVQGFVDTLWVPVPAKPTSAMACRSASSMVLAVPLPIPAPVHPDSLLVEVVDCSHLRVSTRCSTGTGPSLFECQLSALGQGLELGKAHAHLRGSTLFFFFPRA